MRHSSASCKTSLTTPKHRNNEEQDFTICWEAQKCRNQKETQEYGEGQLGVVEASKMQCLEIKVVQWEACGLCKLTYKQKHGFLSTTATTSYLLLKLISVVDFFLQMSKVSFPYFLNCYLADNTNYKHSSNSHEWVCYFCTMEHTALIKGTCPSNYVSYARLKKGKKEKKQTNKTPQLILLLYFQFFFLISCYVTEAKTWKHPLLTFSMVQFLYSMNIGTVTERKLTTHSPLAE